MKTLILILLALPSLIFAKDFSYKKSSRLNSSDYLFGDKSPKRDSLFDDRYPRANFDFQAGIGSDCGKIDLKSTLRASLKNILDAKMFADQGKDIIAGSPMLVTCYFSSQWCSILKHSRISARWQGAARFNACKYINRYVDGRVEDFYKARQDCFQKAIERNGGNMEKAMTECGNSHSWNHDIKDWSGKKDKVSTNRLLESSARWAKMDNLEGRKVLNMLKALVGDTVISKGKVSIDYGPRKMAFTPRLHFREIKKKTFESLCGKLIRKAANEANSEDMGNVISDEDLAEVSGSNNEFLLDRQTVRSLSYMPYKKREIACKKLSASIALTRFTNDMDASLDALEVFSQNPNLPEKRIAEIQKKKSSLRDSVDLTIQLYKNKSEPLNKVLSSINRDGSALIEEETERIIDGEMSLERSERVEKSFWDCADGVMCEGGK